MATESDNVNSGALGTLVAVGTVAFAGIALVVTALVRAEMAEELAVKEVSADRAYRDLVAEQTSKLNAPAAYVDRGRGLVSLPLDRAMELTVAGLSKDPTSATPPAPVGGTGGAGGTASTEAAGNGGGGAAGSGGAAPTAEGEQKKDGGQPKPAENLEKQDEKTDGAKKQPKPAPKAAPGAPGSPAAPAPVAPTPAPAAPSPAPNGQ